MPGIDYKVSLDASGLNTGLKSINAAQSAMGALSSLMRSDFVGAAMQARNAFIALKAAMLANPFVAVVSAIAAVGAALAAINARAREIMGKKGWEKDAQARAELLDLRKRRDEIEAGRKKEGPPQKKAPATAARRLEDEEAIEARERLRRARIDDVIRMRGSRAGGFMDDDGVRRMAGSLVGGFSSRLRPSAFARTAAELDAKRKGIATVTEERTGAEQPVELKGEAVNYLSMIAGALGKEA